MKKQSLFSKALQNNRDQFILGQQSFPVAVKLSQSELQGSQPPPQPQDPPKQNPSQHRDNEALQIHQENLKLIASMDETKIKELQAEIKSTITPKLIEKFQTGQIYHADLKVQNQQPVLENVFKNYMQLTDRDLFDVGKIIIPISQGQFSITDQKEITLEDLMNFLDQVESKGQLQEGIEMLEHALDYFHRQFKDYDYIQINDLKIFRLEILNYMEKENLQLSHFIFSNVNRFFMLIGNSVINFLKKWFTFLIFRPWYSTYDLVLNLASLHPQMKRYTDLIDSTNLSDLLSQIIQLIVDPNEFEYYQEPIINILRVLQIMYLGDIKSIQKILNTLRNNQFEEFTLIIKIAHLSNSGYSLLLKYNPDLPIVLFRFGLLLLKEQELLSGETNIVIPVLLQLLKNQHHQSTYLSHILWIAQIYEKIYCKNLGQLTISENCPTNNSSNFIAAFSIAEFSLFLRWQSFSIPVLYNSLIQKLYELLNENALNEGNMKSGLASLSIFLQELKLAGKLIISKKERQTQWGQIKDHFQSIFKEPLLAYAKDHRSLQSAVIQHQICCKLLDIHFIIPKQNNEEIILNSSSAEQGLFNLIFFKTIDVVDQNQVFKIVNQQFIIEIDNFSQQPEDCKYSPEFLLIRILKLLTWESNFTHRLNQTKTLKMLQRLLSQLDWVKLGRVINTNVSLFERLLQRFTFDSFNNAIFSNVMFMFVHPVFKADIHNLILQEFVINRSLELLEIDISGQFLQTPKNLSLIPLNTYKSYVDKIQSTIQNQLTLRWCALVKAW